ncbi:MAG: hypothetical protein ACK5LY_00945 [Lachnospirales bacterium]
MYAIDKKVYNSDRGIYVYTLEDTEDKCIKKIFESNEVFYEGDFVEIFDNCLVRFDKESTFKKEEMKSRLNRLFKK